MDQRRTDILEAMQSGQVRQNTWGWAVCEYLLEHPEEAEEMAMHHYQSFLGKKLEMMVSDISTGRHANPITVHNLVRKSIRVIDAN